MLRTRTQAQKGSQNWLRDTAGEEQPRSSRSSPVSLSLVRDGGGRWKARC
uniref:Uncharacterized protein n=1 Tax=Anguilla anguilla TaxID=7936 RepID=A0A0E9PKS2_ANGAN